MNYSSKLIEEAVEYFSSLPGVGKKTALRFVLHLLKKEKKEVEGFGSVLLRLREELKYCRNCHNISDHDLCGICNDSSRDRGTICVVEDTRDVMAVENTRQYKGIYHVLGGIISPIEGIGPSDLNIPTLLEKAGNGEIKEVIMALSTTMEGDTTNFYIYRKLKDKGVSVSAIARGIAVGDELEYADEITLGRSILNRLPYEKTLISR